jgi:hypothetical protein
LLLLPACILAMTGKRSPSMAAIPTEDDSPLQQKQRVERDDKEKRF